MRIIGGKLKGKKISFVKSSITRPLKDSVKESIFNIIQHSNLFKINLQNSTILDLYSGVGSFGLECVSRGAKKIIFVEKDKNAIKILNNNLTILSISNKVSVVNEEIDQYLKHIEKIKFDLFFLDPPFLNKTFLKYLNEIKIKGIYKKDHLIIIHRPKKSLDNFENILSQLVVRNYGRSKIIFGKFK